MDVDSNASVNPVYGDKIDGNSIRLLKFSQSQDGRLTGRLKKFALAHAPHFYSASYTWGAKAYSGTVIELKTGQLPVLQGLLPFLRMVSRHEDFHDEDWWWIDSLSINLADGQEREQQVQIMADIYKKARRAMVWLGEEVEDGSDCTGAIDFLHYLQNLQPLFSGKNAEYVRNNLRSSGMSVQWASVSNLLSRPWWTRVWTLQEMILPREVKFFCGNTSISRGKFKAAMYSIFLCSVGDRDMEVELIPRQAFDTAFNRRRVHQWHVHPKARGIALVAVLAYLGNHSATDSRDRVYSVLGIITARDRKLIGKPEYTTTVQHQYSKLVRSFYDEYQNLDILCFSHLFSRYSGPSDPGYENAVPSWAPDWRVYTEFASPVPLMASQSASEQHIGNFRPLHGQKWDAMYDAPGQRLRDKADVRFHDNLKELWCNGVILDKIESVGALGGCDPRCRSFVCARDEPLHGLVQGDISMHKRTLESADLVSILTKIARSLVLGRQDKYLRFVAPQYYTSDFLVLCNACLESEILPEDPGETAISTFATWFRGNRHLRLGTHTLEELVENIISSSNPPLFDSLPVPSIHPGSRSDRLPMYPPNTSADANSDYADNFLSRFLDTIRKKSRRLMVTNGGLVGMAPCRARPGDAVVALFACSIPLVLRKAGARDGWQVVGEAYVDGYMNGEAGQLIKRGTSNIHRFRLV
ncbi:uncharacterized protein CC84DRAFT_1187957 [Paraphaeosphaeria sporulosa]|uniref:Heterokaryon incompatibility domain-containing protein n=1 Tax=Paraphaeosphaeria sporulosa TaxID=1460663 RepID=A0A177CCR7_9PLEO|nr:uncharacterized protein CC84DRAFT_1187957 [Paraphaeosphaeria sporulosa]OAG05116.1 hypothetical protein CC84DRAFT_1187957 [Paraphaeosphaeria sporulosa]